MKRVFLVFVTILIILYCLVGCDLKREGPTEALKEDPGVSKRLANRYLDLFANESYFIKFHVEYEDFVDENTKSKITEEYEIAVQSGNLSIKSTGEDGESTMLIVDGKKHILNHQKKVYQVSVSTDEDRWMFPSGGYEFKESGTSELFGVSYMYEEYTTDIGIFRFFFDGQKLVGIEAFSEKDKNQENDSMQMKILDWSMKVPIGTFDIPDGYKEE